MGFSRQEYWSAIYFSRGSSRPRERTKVSLIVGRRFTLWTTRGWGPIECFWLWIALLLLSLYALIRFNCLYPYFQPIFFIFPHLFILYICNSVSVLFVDLFWFLDSTCKWNHTVQYLSLSDLFHLIPSRFIYDDTNGKISFFLWLSNSLLYTDG